MQEKEIARGIQAFDAIHVCVFLVIQSVISDLAAFI